MDVAADAAESFAASCAPAILPDETVYSWCARFNRLNDVTDVQATSHLLFGHRTAGLRNDFPFHLAYFHTITRGALGTLSDLLMRRTLYGFRAPFLPSHARNDIRRYLLYGGPSGELRCALGLSRAGLVLANRLKLCADCVREQRSQHGFAWWMASHQPPSTFSCRIHHQWLRFCAESRPPSSINMYWLPEVFDSVSVANGLHERLARCSQLSNLDRWGSYVSQQQNLQLAGEMLRQTYRLQVKARKWVSGDGHVRLELLRDAFLSYYGDVLRLFPDKLLEDLAGVNGGFLATLLTKNSPRHHPMKHLLLLSFLFETPDDFFSVHTKVTAVHADGGDTAVRALLRSNAVI
ncbi:TnsD family Tn7-like transposition protein [Paraburkholderia fungorum]|uniref:TnsD family Tn7-like transposition protein n=1 Tax=Paraburkholderia fungorum TaxID=134537 RepID=UPI0038B6BE86